MNFWQNRMDKEEVHGVDIRNKNIVFLHGLGQTSSSWHETITAMKADTDASCPDLSELLSDKEVNYQNLYMSFCKYCDSFTKPFHICGLSLGGILALQYTLEHPDKVRSMVLIGTQFVMPKGLLKIQNFLFRIMPERSFGEMGFAKRDFINLSKSMMNLNFGQQLHKITCPVLVICGEKDTANKKASLQMKEQIPQAELSIIKNAGHEVNLEASKELGGMLTDFYRKLSIQEE